MDRAQLTEQLDGLIMIEVVDAKIEDQGVWYFRIFGGNDLHNVTWHFHKAQVVLQHRSVSQGEDQPESQTGDHQTNSHGNTYSSQEAQGHQTTSRNDEDTIVGIICFKLIITYS